MRHVELVDIMAQLQISDSVYNRMKIFSKTITTIRCRDVFHFNSDESQHLSGIRNRRCLLLDHDSGPAVCDGRQPNLQYADDTYLVVPAANSARRQAEIRHVEQWTTSNKLQLNHRAK